MDYYTGNFWLSIEEQKVNATYLKGLLLEQEWTINAICGLLGNAQIESTINPGIWQNLKENINNGYGLLQWTPASKYINWCKTNNLDITEMETAVLRLQYELKNNIQYYKTSRWPITFAQFIKSEDNPGDLAEAWLYNYERPAEYKPANRRNAAINWWNYLTDGQEIPPHIPNYRPYNSKMPFYFMTLRGRRY